MKKILFFLPLLILAACNGGQGEMTGDSLYVTVNMPDGRNNLVKVSIMTESGLVEMASAQFEEGVATLKVDSLDFDRLLFVDIPAMQRRFYLFDSKGETSITMSEEVNEGLVLIEGGEYADIINEYYGLMNDFQEMNEGVQQEMKKAREANDFNTQMMLNSSLMANHQKFTQDLLELAKRAKGFGAFIALAHLNDNEYADLRAVYDNIPVQLGNAASVAQLKEIIDSKKRTALGEPLIDLMMPSPTGENIRISENLGKSYTLIDFWASWCRPCRAENPNVVAAYNTYKDRGFSVIGVSLDQPGKKNEWVQAIEQDKLTWTHMSDLQHWNSEAVEKYGFNGIPYNVMVDENGIIVAKDLRGQELQDWLAERL